MKKKQCRDNSVTLSRLQVVAIEQRPYGRKRRTVFKTNASDEKPKYESLRIVYNERKYFYQKSASNKPCFCMHLLGSK